MSGQRRYTLGFELETQSTEGQRHPGCYEDEADWAYELARENYNDEDLKEAIFDYGTELSELRSSTLEKILEGLGLCDIDDYDRFFDENLAEQVTDSLYERYRDDPYAYGYALRVDFSVPSFVEVGEEGTVDGFEFRTVGGLSINKAVSTAKELFELDHEVDEGCSFHIHVKDNIETEHPYDARAQARMMNYLLQHVAEWPETVQKRMISEYGDRWARWHLQAGKGAAVSHRDYVRTWEFRFFGNVQNALEAEQCLLLARRAMMARFSERWDITEEGLDALVSSTKYAIENNEVRPLVLTDIDNNNEVAA